MAKRFFSPIRIVDDTINGEPFVPGLTEVPILRNALAYTECAVRHIFTHGDHAVVVMDVVEGECRGEVHPLTIAASPWECGG